MKKTKDIRTKSKKAAVKKEPERNALIKVLDAAESYKDQPPLMSGEPNYTERDIKRFENVTSYLRSGRGIPERGSK